MKQLIKHLLLMIAVAVLFVTFFTLFLNLAFPLAVEGGMNIGEHLSDKNLQL